MTELGKPEYPKFEAAHLKPAAATPDAMRNAIAAVLRAAESNKKEIDVDGQPVKWAEVLGESLANLQQPDGSFAEDAQTHGDGAVRVESVREGILSCTAGVSPASFKNAVGTAAVQTGVIQ